MLPERAATTRKSTTPRAKYQFCLRTFTVSRPKSTASTSFDKSSLIRTISAVSKATSVPAAPMATPTVALASATEGVAMGAAGTDVALETADIVLMSDDLSKLVEAVDLGRETVKVLKQNWYFALGVVLFLVVAALSGSIPLPLAVVGHEGNTLVVVLSGLRLLVYEPKSKEERRVGRRDDTKMRINGWWRRSDNGSRTVS